MNKIKAVHEFLDDNDLYCFIQLAAILAFTLLFFAAIYSNQIAATYNQYKAGQVKQAQIKALSNSSLANDLRKHHISFRIVSVN